MTLVSLEDCALYVNRVPPALGSDSKFELQLGLPKMMNLTGITPEINPERWAQNHEVYHYESHGALYVPCNYKAYFWSRDYLEDETEERNTYQFNLGSAGWGMEQRRFQSFRMSNIDGTIEDFVGQRDKKAIILALNSDQFLSKYLQNFFGWVNEFIKRHGDLRWYDPLDGVYRSTEEFFERLKRDNVL